MTPTQLEAYLNQKRFHANIAFRAANLPPGANADDIDAARGASPPRDAAPAALRHKMRDSATAHPPHDAADAGAGRRDELGWLVEVCELDPAPKPARQGGTPIAAIQDVVARRFNVTIYDMVSARKPREVVLPRQLAMYLAKLLTPRTLPDIGSKFGDRDHSTVIHAIRKIERLAAADNAFAAVIASLCEELR